VRRVFSSDGTAPAYDYDPYGNPLQSTAPLTDFGYASLFTARNSGLNLATFRAYDPSTGRWISRDPIGERGDPSGNLYGYVGQSPLANVDPDGRCIEDGCVLETAITVTCLKNPACRAAAAGAAIAAGKGLSNGFEYIYNICFPSVSDDGRAKPPVAGATPGRETKGRSKQWEKPGGAQAADDDFDSKNPTDVQSIPGGGRRGTLPNGDTIVVRPNSTDGRPTVEIQSGKNRIKIRYGQ
jgi:RHS repeat-associated protein